MPATFLPSRSSCSSSGAGSPPGSTTATREACSDAPRIQVFEPNRLSTMRPTKIATRTSLVAGSAALARRRLGGRRVLPLLPPAVREPVHPVGERDEQDAVDHAQDDRAVQEEDEQDRQPEAHEAAAAKRAPPGGLRRGRAAPRRGAAARRGLRGGLGSVRV